MTSRALRRVPALGLVAALVAVPGCRHRGAPAAAPPADRPAPAAAAPEGPAPATGPAGLGAPCPSAGCPAGQACVEWCGIAGCRPGSVFRTCEIPCKTDAQCPPGHACGTVADGPGRVCVARPAPAPRRRS